MCSYDGDLPNKITCCAVYVKVTRAHQRRQNVMGKRL